MTVHAEVLRLPTSPMKRLRRLRCDIKLELSVFTQVGRLSSVAGCGIQTDSFQYSSQYHLNNIINAERCHYHHRLHHHQFIIITINLPLSSSTYYHHHITTGCKINRLCGHAPVQAGKFWLRWYAQHLILEMRQNAEVWPANCFFF